MWGWFKIWGAVNDLWGCQGVLAVPTGVDNDVFGEIAHVNEGFVADGAFVGSDIIMMADVVGQLA